MGELFRRQFILKISQTIEFTIGMNMEAIDVFDVNSVAIVLTRINMSNVISLVSDIEYFTYSPILVERPDTLLSRIFNSV